MNNVELVIKQELLPDPPGGAGAYQEDTEDPIEEEEEEVETGPNGGAPTGQSNNSPSHSVTSNSSLSNHGASHTEDKFLLSALLSGSPASIQSGSRKRKSSPPIKTSSASFSSKDSETDEEGRMTPSAANNNGAPSNVGNFAASAMLREMATKRVKPEAPAEQHPLLKSYLSSSSESKKPQITPQVRDFSVMSEERIRMQQINSQPRPLCPICGDRANGLHYGIYSCEGCKNFFKRSVLVCLERPYVCKYSGNCSVSVTAIDGVKQKGPRCQACRYAACLDAGMYHSGVQRSRGGRHNHAGSSTSQQTPNKKQSNSYLQLQTENDEQSRSNWHIKESSSRQKTNGNSAFPQMQLPDIGSRLKAAHLHNLIANNSSPEQNELVGHHFMNGDLEDYGHPAAHGGNNNNHNNETDWSTTEQDPLDCEYLRGYQTENLLAEVKLLRSRNRELEVSNEEKDKQIRLFQRQLSVCKKALAETKKRAVLQPKRKKSTEGESPTLSQNPTLKALLSNHITRRRYAGAPQGGGDGEASGSAFGGSNGKSGSITLTPVRRNHQNKDADGAPPCPPPQAEEGET